jgi:drug/metabolite transporter (DMT)-like permease
MGAVGQILLKVGANRLGGITLTFNGLLSIAKNYYILIGLMLFGTSFLLWVKVLTKNDLSYVYPMVSLSYVIIILVSRFLFNEPFTTNKMIGIAAIVGGVFIINK